MLYLENISICERYIKFRGIQLCLSIMVFTKSSKINLPYQLDGIMFTPQNQIYTKIKDLKYKIYKWKPPNLNSIDFYIKRARSGFWKSFKCI